MQRIVDTDLDQRSCVADLERRNSASGRPVSIFSSEVSANHRNRWRNWSTAEADEVTFGHSRFSASCSN